VSEPRPRYALVLEALPDEVPAGRRLAWLLRVALRRFRLRCLEAKEVEPSPAASGADAPATSVRGVGGLRRRGAGRLFS
jgi:hypothetical protein